MINKSSKIDIFDHRVIFIFLLAYFIGVPFFFKQVYGVVTLVDWLAIAYALSGSGAYFLVSTSKISFKSLIASQRNSGDAYLLAIFFIIVDILLILQQFRGLSENNEYTSSYSIDNHASLYVQLIFLSFLYGKFYVYSYFCFDRKRRFYFIFLLQILLYAFSPVRLLFLMPFIVFGIYGYYCGYIKLSVQRLLMIFFILPFLMVILLLSRGSGSKSKLDVLINLYKNYDFDRFSELLYVALESHTSYNYYYEIVSANYVRFESGIIRNAFLPISRGLWREKPEAISRVIAQEFNSFQYNQGGGSVATIFGDGFVNGHLFGILFVCSVYAFIMAGAYRPMRNFKNVLENKDPAIIMFYAVTLHQSLFFFRGFFSESIWRLVILFFIFFIFRKFQVQKYTIR